LGKLTKSGYPTKNLSPGDKWKCPLCGEVVTADQWGIRHSGPGHTTNFRNDYPEYRPPKSERSPQAKKKPRKKKPEIQQKEIKTRTDLDGQVSIFG
jgi:transposase